VSSAGSLKLRRTECSQMLALTRCQIHQSFDPARTLAIASEVVAIISRRANGRKLISDNNDQLLQKVLAAVSSLVEKNEVVRP
jgi:hypothetical protein